MASETLRDIAEPPELVPVRAGEEFDEKAVEAHLRERVPDLEGALQVLQFPGGHANLTYLQGFSETLDQVCDSYLFHRLVALGSPDLNSPLISISGSPRKMRECEVKLTAFGQKVLAGEDNHVRENGIDDWVGGVHLSAERSVTFREGDSLVLSL